MFVIRVPNQPLQSIQEFDSNPFASTKVLREFVWLSHFAERNGTVVGVSLVRTGIVPVPVSIFFCRSKGTQ